ncbi:MAG TPA: hypothetical protein VJN89_11745 [Candidatus Acidoferrum sp.]|nr:hypothetical protein [Candidatus Acidoferrum sp.]
MRKAIAIFALTFGLSTALRASTGAEVQSWKYNPETKMISLKLVNTSGKDITSYNMAIILTYADGTTDALPGGVAPSERMENALGPVIRAQMNSDPALQQYAHGFAAGSTRYDSFPSMKDVADVQAVFNVVIYSDCTAEVLPGGERAFKQLMAIRKGPLLAMQKVSEVVKRALADPTVTNPNEAARTELRQLVLAGADKHHTPEDIEDYEEMTLRQAVSDLDRMATRTSLQKYVEDTDRQIELLLPHTQISLMSAK